MKGAEEYSDLYTLSTKQINLAVSPLSLEEASILRCRESFLLRHFEDLITKSFVG
jgi:hypothetical protein